MLIFAQSAVGIALLVTGLLIARSFVQLANRPLGFDPGRVRIADIELPPDGASTPERRLQMRRTSYQDMKRRIPAALIDGIPGMTLNTGISRPDFDGRAGVNAWPVSGTFFSVFGLRLVRGRLYTDEEAFANAAVVVIDQPARRGPVVARPRSARAHGQGDSRTAAHRHRYRADRPHRSAW